ncbi:MAG: sugar ABC transporter permease [Spirochaetales bacterium]|nr:sugar ABC transporter permease [Spirochaetales bacterium]
MKKITSFRKEKSKDTLIDVAFLSPQLILFSVLTILPLLIALPISFTDKLSIQDTDYNFIGIKNFITIFTSSMTPLFLRSVLRTFVFAIINYFFVFLFGLPLALLMFENKLKMQNFFFTIIFLPYMISSLGIGLFLVLLLAKDWGTVNLILIEMNIIKEGINLKNEIVASIALPFIIGWRSAGFNMVIFLSGLLTIPQNTIDAADIDGCSYINKLRYIYFPQIIPSIILLTIFCMVGSFAVFGEPIALGALSGNESVLFFSIVLFITGMGAGSSSALPGTFAQTVSMSIVIYFPLLIIAVLLIRLQKKLQY